jgi:hypothetical protein
LHLTRDSTSSWYIPTLLSHSQAANQRLMYLRTN